MKKRLTLTSSPLTKVTKQRNDLRKLVIAQYDLIKVLVNHGDLDEEKLKPITKRLLRSLITDIVEGIPLP